MRVSVMGGVTEQIIKWLVISRWWSFYTDFIAVTVGSILALPRFNMLLYGLMLVGTIPINAFANFMNDIYDFRHGEWDSKRATVRNPNPITKKLIGEGALWNASAVAIMIAALCGLYIYAVKGPIILFFGIVGVILAYTYSAGKHNIKSLTLGELVVFFVYGPLMTNAAYFVETGSFGVNAAYTSVIVGISIMLILFANNIRDIKADRAINMKTAAGKLGLGRSITIFSLLVALMYILLAVFVIASILPIFSALALLSIPYAIKVNRIMKRKVPDNSAKLMSNLAMLFFVLLSLGILIGYILGL